MQQLKSLILSRDASSTYEIGQWSESKSASGVAAWIPPEHARYLFHRRKSHAVRYLSRSEEGDKTQSKGATLRDRSLNREPNVATISYLAFLFVSYRSVLGCLPIILSFASCSLIVAQIRPSISSLFRSLWPSENSPIVPAVPPVKH
jgi:hypothetical protein